MTSAGANTWSVPLEINNLEAKISSIPPPPSGVLSVTSGNSNIAVGGTPTNPTISGTLTTLTNNVLTANYSLSGNTAGNPSFVLGGTEEFLVITTDLTSQIRVSGSGVTLGTPATAYTVVAPTVTPSNTNDTQVATTAFVQSAIGAVSTPTLSAVLTAGNTATNSITLNNSGLGTNVINLLPNAGATDPQITLTDGTTTNTINKNGYTTRNSVQNITHYLNFSDSSSTGTGAIQKTAGISCNPSTNTITATTLRGAYVATAPTDLGGFDVTNGAQITATTFQGALQGNADTATTASKATDLAGGVVGNIPYQNTVDDTVFLINGASGTVLTSGGVGGIPTWTTPSTTATTVSITDTNTNTTYYPTFVSASGASQTLRADIATTALSYNPNSALLTVRNVKPTIITDSLGQGGGDAQVLTANASNQLVWRTAGSPFYGYGNDGTVYFDGSLESQAYSFSTYNSGTLTYTLTRDIFALTITVNATVSVITAGFRIFATTSIIVNSTGIISNNGGNASGITAGTGAPAGYFKASGNGASGLGTASAGAVGTAPTVPTASTFVGSFGGRGASARAGASTTTFVGTSVMTVANYNLSVPANADSGRSIVNSIAFWNQRSIATATALWQPTGSLGGASGSKSIIGTTATSGAGGGGGGFMFLASPIITADAGAIQVVGGNGGNGAGTGGNFGGGGGGGGGVIGVVSTALLDTGIFSISGGSGGTSIALGTLSPVGETQGTGTGTTANPFSISPTSVLARNTMYVLSLHITGSAGTTASVNGITGGSIAWGNLASTTFGTDRRLEVWVGFTSDAGFSNDPRIIITFDISPTTVRYIIDGIQDTQYADGNYPVDQNITATGTGTSASTTLTNPPSLATNLQYSVVARSTGTAPVAGTGNTLLTQGTTAPVLISEVATGRQTNSQTWTTSADWCMTTLDLSASGAYEAGCQGELGKIVQFVV